MVNWYTMLPGSTDHLFSKCFVVNPSLHCILLVDYLLWVGWVRMVVWLGLVLGWAFPLQSSQFRCVPYFLLLLPILKVVMRETPKTKTVKNFVMNS